jgi:alpha/beta superfamily hydrolase
MCHGLGGDKVGKGRFLVLLSEMLAKEGIASVRFDFRGCGDSEGEFSSITPNRCLDDVRSVMQWIEDQTMFDLTKGFLFGRSFGGLISILTASQWKSCRGVAVQSPPFNAATFAPGLVRGIQPHMQLREDKRAILFEGEPLTPDFVTQMEAVDMRSALHGISHIPFLHISGSLDTIIDATHTEQYQRARERASASSKFLVLPQADHRFSKWADRQTAVRETVEWFISQM